MKKREILFASVAGILLLLCGLSLCTNNDTGSDKPMMDETFRLTGEDAEYDKAPEKTFGHQDEMIKFEQVGGNPIYWNYIDVVVVETGTDDEIELELANINGMGIKANAPDDAYKTTAGDVVVYWLKNEDDAGKIMSPAYIDVTVYNGNKEVFIQTGIRIV